MERMNFALDLPTIYLMTVAFDLCAAFGDNDKFTTRLLVAQGGVGLGVYPISRTPSALAHQNVSHPHDIRPCLCHGANFLDWQVRSLTFGTFIFVLLTSLICSTIPPPLGVVPVPKSFQP